jgi:ABC-2 type transport system permease protein
MQLNTDATRVGQAFSGSAYVQTIVNGEVQTFLLRYRANMKAPVEVEERLRFNPNLIRSRFGAVVALIDMITMLSVLLTGAALIRERERGTVEHLLVMPVTPFQIMTSKIWSMGLVVLPPRPRWWSSSRE